MATSPTPPSRGRGTQILATDAAKGRADLTLIDGRPPAGPDEVAVGPKTRERLPGRDANTLEVGTEDGGRHSFRIVGTAAFPILNYPDYDDGIWMAHEALPGLAVASGNAVLLIRLADGADLGGKRPGLEELRFDFVDTGAHAGSANLDEVGRFPQALAAFLAVLGLVFVGHALLSSPRRRRRDLAVLRTLGLVRRQVAATLAVQATAVTAVGLCSASRSASPQADDLGSGRDRALVVRRPIVPQSSL